MKSNDLTTREEIRTAMQKALAENDAAGFVAAFDQMTESIGESVRQDYTDLIGETDSKVLASRGVRQLTSEETKYYQELSDALRSQNPKQALTNLTVVMPETVIDSVFEDLRTNHPLLSKITFTPANSAIKMLVNTNGYQEATWGNLCGEIVKELLSGFKEIETGMHKLSAFMPVCKAMLDLGPVWLDNYVRQVLYEALANGLEAAIVKGDGNNKPIGMNRQVGEGVTVTGGVYPEKEKIVVTDLSVKTIGNLLSKISVTEKGNQRTVSDVILLVNPIDYYQKIMPATTILAPDGTYRSDVMPYPMDVIQSAAVPIGTAVFGLAKRYFAPVGMSREGQIEYSDQYQFLEDNRVYLIKLYGNGLPLDNNAFLNLDISKLQPASYRVSVVDTTKSDNAELSSLSIGSLSLTPKFNAATTSYTVTTSNATNTVTAITADSVANAEIKLGSTVIENGGSATWSSGSNTLTVKVTAEDGTTTKTYTVTVTKE